MEKEEHRIHGHWILTGDAAKVVLEKIASMKKQGIPVFGKQRAIQVLLCELYKMKKSTQKG